MTFVCDSGNKYLTKVFNDFWVAAQGFSPRDLHGDVRDLITQRYAEGGVVSIGPDDTLLTAYNRMRSSDISQLPVVDHGKLVGILDESDVLAAVEGRDAARAKGFAQPVKSAMTSKVRTLRADAALEDLVPVFERNEVAVVVDGEEFMGLITRVDLINHLRLTAR